jgi:hypothetical protein
MRINELTGYKNDPVYLAFQDTYGLPDFISKIKKLGYAQSINLSHRLIGDGAFAGVFAKPDDPYVIKIYDPDPGYEKYLKYVVANQTNPHVPKLRGRPVRLGSSIRIVRIEKLSPVKTPEQHDVYEKIRNYVDDFGKDYAYSIINQKIVDGMFPKIGPLLQELSANKQILDLGKQNVMFRGDIPVITDPYADF